jgi:hypothetical protein
MNKSIRWTVIFLISVFTHTYLFAQSTKDNLSKTILSKDSIFWKGYNECNIQNMKQFLADDVEFYHDKGGITLGAEELMNTIKKNLCSNENFRLRRESVEGSLKVYPLENSGVIYGAILTGEHVFYVLEKGKPEFLDGLASFTHLWLLKDNVWKMTRIFSYDHGPADRSKRK